MALKFGGDLEAVTGEDWLASQLNGDGGGSGHADAPPVGTPSFSDLGDLEPDPDPGFGAPGLGERVAGKLFGGHADDAPTGRSTAVRVTKAIHKDIRGKVATFLTIAGGTLHGRDPHCGGALLSAIPDQPAGDGEVAGLATAITDLLVDSPDVVKWFTSTGKFSKWLTLAMAVQPVVTTAFHHHVTHAITDAPPDAAPPDWTAYGA